MCRACYAVVVAPADQQNRLRRAAGLDVQVMAMTESLAEASTIDPQPDVLIVASESGREEVTGLQAAVVWVGSDPPAWAHQMVAPESNLDEAIPGAVVRALIERRKR